MLNNNLKNQIKNLLFQVSKKKTFLIGIFHNIKKNIFYPKRVSKKYLVSELSDLEKWKLILKLLTEIVFENKLTNESFTI